MTTGQIFRANNNDQPAWSLATYPDTAGTSGNVLTSDGNNWVSQASGVNPSTTVVFFDDFLGAISNGAAGSLIWQGTSWYHPFTASNNHPGIIGNNALGGANIPVYLSAFIGPTITNGGILLGGGSITFDYLFNIATLSVAGLRYIFRIGLGDTTSTSDQANGVYLEYSDNVNSGNWQYKTASASTRTTSNSSVAAATGWHKLSVTINAGASSISFSIDGVSLGAAITTNIPTTNINPFFYMIAPAHNLTNGLIGIDYFKYQQTLTTPR